MFDQINSLHLAFHIRKPLNKSEARKLIVDCGLIFLKNINEDKGIRPHLKNYPATSENIEIRIFPSYPDGSETWFPLMSAISLSNGKISFRTTETELENLFSQFGQVTKVNIIQDRETGRSRGFGFVEMESESATAAISALDGTEFEGRNLRVNVAREKTRRPRRDRDRNRACP